MRPQAYSHVETKWKGRKFVIPVRHHGPDENNIDSIVSYN